jgi:hypothetical protein
MRPTLRVIPGGRKERTAKRARTYRVRRFNERGEAVYLTAIMAAPTLYGGGNCA